MTTSPEFTSNRDNFCYRHPDRQSFVLCQRCLRTICPQCQTQAAVGVICPECMKAERKAETPAQRKARRRWGGRGSVSLSYGGGRPVVTYALLALTAFVSLLALIPGGFGDAVTNQLGFLSLYVMPGVSLYPFEPWRLLTVLFVHGNFIHLALNMLALWMLGQIVEPMLGRWRFLALYLLSGLGGSVVAACLAPTVGVVGASGAIFGLMAALLIIGRHVGANVTGILVILAINFVFGVLFAGISWQAHLGGVLAGALVAFVFTRTRRPEQRVWQIVWLSVIAVALVAIVLIVPSLVLLAR